jgi:hypothetical protein
LPDRSNDLALQAGRERHANHPLFANDADFDTSAGMAKSHERGHPVIQKISEVDLVAGFLQNCVLR